jgi:iron donor protein CyaY
MTESTNHGPGSALFDRIRQMVDAHGVDIRQHLNGNALRLEFADGQRILVNLDAQTRNVWVAARSGGSEFVHSDGTWRAHDQSELFTRLDELITHTIASNPLNARLPVAHPQPTPRPEPAIYYEAKQSHGLRNILIVMLAGLIGFWAAQKLQSPKPAASENEAQNLSLSQLDPGQQCETGFPANGSITIFPGSGLRADGPNDPEFTLKNDHSYPLLLILAKPRTVIPSMSVLIHARQNVTLRLPAGQYDMMFGVGNTWCNAKRGFSDGHILKFDKSLTVEMDKPVQLAMQSSGAGMEDFQLFIRSAAPEAALPPPTFSGDGSMEVQRHANGHFYLPGSIENVPVTFMVDTGASVTSISSDLARQAGIRNCKEVQFQTANGTATGCIALVTHMTLGNFVLENITVAVMPNMETNLLGANVLRNFQVSQSDSTMLIGRH